MLKLKKFLFAVGLGMVISLSAGAGEKELCAPFRSAMVDESIVAEMLSAAQDGNLYQIQPASSRVGFCVEGPTGEVKGRFRTFQGGLTMQPVNADKGRVMVIVDTASLETGGIFVESLLKSESFFDVEHYPEILFVSTGFKWVSRKEAVLIGDLTLRGVTRKVGFVVKLVENDKDEKTGAQKIIVQASTSIRRSEFGINSMSSLVSNSVNLCMSVDAVRITS